MGCRGCLDVKIDANPFAQIVRLDRVREIILNSVDRLDMNYWHKGSGWVDRTCDEEIACGTSHCLAGWLQVLSTDPDIRAEDPKIAAMSLAPVAVKMFYADKTRVIEWLRNRSYVQELGTKEAS
jgi:hypothetical protein